MASYPELFNLMQGESNLRNRIVVAIVVAAESIRNENAQTENHANRILWAAQAFANPAGVSRKVLMAVLAANKDVPIAAIASASDTALQINVDAVVDLFAMGA